MHNVHCKSYAAEYMWQYNEWYSTTDVNPNWKKERMCVSVCDVSKKRDKEGWKKSLWPFFTTTLEVPEAKLNQNRSCQHRAAQQSSYDNIFWHFYQSS